MEHEVFVPVPAERLREVLEDPVRLARAVPGLQQDAGAEPVAGRLKVRVGGHTITYRGAARVVRQDDGSYAVEGEADEARGSGAVKLSLAVRVLDAEGGATLVFAGTATVGGRISELPSEAVAAAGARLLNRFGEGLGVVAEEAVEVTEAPEAPEAPDVADVAEVEVVEASEDDDVPGVVDEGAGPPDLPAEAAHARRTMIGRSAEEVDHAPPRGRYAPVPAPQTIAPPSVLRWAAPAAALAVASVIVVGRALRRRR